MSPRSTVSRGLDARLLVELYDERAALTKAMAEHPRPTGEMAREVLAKGKELDAACEFFRLAYYPRRHRVIVGLRQVWAMSRTGRSATLVHDGGAPFDLQDTSSDHPAGAAS